MKRGDSLLSIAYTYGTSQRVLMQLNDLAHADIDLVEGSVLDVLVDLDHEAGFRELSPVQKKESSVKEEE